MADEENGADQYEDVAEDSPAKAEDEQEDGVKQPEVKVQAEHEASIEGQIDEDEGKRKMEEAQQARLDKQAQEMAEYEDLRRVEREKEAEQIRLLREKQEARKTKVIEESDRLKDLAAQEEQRRKHEDEERKRKKLEAEREKQEEKDRKRREAEERLKPKKPNYVITKRAEGDKNPNVTDPAPVPAGPVVFGREDMQKSKEQLEEEKRAILSQRIQPISLTGCDKKMLMAKAKELYEHLRKLHGDNYDLEELMKRQQYDMMELQERARQMNKGGKRNQSAVQVNESFDRLADKFSGAPPRIQLCSKYERHTDPRTYNERRELFKKEDNELLEDIAKHQDDDAHHQEA